MISTTTTIYLPIVRIEAPSVAAAYDRLQQYTASVQAGIPFDAPDNAQLSVTATITRIAIDGAVAGEMSACISIPPQADPVAVVPLNTVQE